VFRPPNFHAPDEPILHQVRVLDEALGHDEPREVADDLVYRHNQLPVRLVVDSQRIDMRIERRPLPRLVVTDLIAAMNHAAFHAVGPFHVRVHG